jgi:hypothetical protein
LTTGEDRHRLERSNQARRSRRRPLGQGAFPQPPMIIPVHTYSVTPRLPERLQALDEISRNVWWAWNYDAAQLYSRLDHKLWLETYHKPRASF